MTKILLCLGAGNRLAYPEAPNWIAINHDRIRHRPEITDVWDLDVRPWPWATSSIHSIEAWAVLEHLKLGLEESMEECHRILKPDGLLQLKMPIWGKAKAYGDPTHRRSITEETPLYFDPETDLGKAALIYGLSPWRVVKVALIANRTSVFAEMRTRK